LALIAGATAGAIEGFITYPFECKSPSLPFAKFKKKKKKKILVAGSDRRLLGGKLILEFGEHL
jgi:hypothetical protein